jgi:hypothetical protein
VSKVWGTSTTGKCRSVNAAIPPSPAVPYSAIYPVVNLARRPHCPPLPPSISLSCRPQCPLGQPLPPSICLSHHPSLRSGSDWLGVRLRLENVVLQWARASDKTCEVEKWHTYCRDCWTWTVMTISRSVLIAASRVMMTAG